MEVVHSLNSRAKVIYQDQKDFNNEVKNIGHNLMFNEYPQQFADSVMKPSRSNCPSSDTIDQGTVTIPYVMGIFKKFRHTGNRFNVRTIFKNKHTIHGTMMKNGPVRDAQEMKQCVYNIPCDCSRCYNSETSRPLEVYIKKHKYHLTQGLLEKSTLPNMYIKEGTKYIGKK
jgi:hypothetical protein